MHYLPIFSFKDELRRLHHQLAIFSGVRNELDFPGGCRFLAGQQSDAVQVIEKIEGWNRVSRYLYEPAYYLDIIHHSVNPFKSKSSKIAEMYLGKGLSAAQIAGELGISKTAVLERLHTLGIRNVASIGERMTNPNNYRASVVPYGYRKIDGQLVANKKEIRICRLVVQLINERKLSLQKIKNRSGNIWWDHSMVRAIAKRWSGKL